MKTMTLYRPNTFEGLLGHSGTSEIEHYFDALFGDSVFAPATMTLKHMPAVDVRETEKAYLLEMELPGYDEKDIEVQIEGNSLFIASKHKEAKEEKAEDDKGNWILRERRVSSFSRLFKLPENANPEEISAEFKNGVLSMEIKKRAEAQKRAIQISVK